MSLIFHKSCYTTRSSGYKYRTLSTNTGEKNKRHNTNGGNTFESNFEDLKRKISTRIDKQLDESRKARDTIQEKLIKIDSKINSMLELKDTLAIMRQDLQSSESTLAALMVKINKLETLTLDSEGYSLQSKGTSFRFQTPILEEKEIYSSTIRA